MKKLFLTPLMLLSSGAMNAWPSLPTFSEIKEKTNWALDKAVGPITLAATVALQMRHDINLFLRKL